MLDAIIISDYGNDTFALSSSMRLTLEGKTGTIQVIENYLGHNGHVIEPVNDGPNWHNAKKLNGVVLLDLLIRNGYTAALIDTFSAERAEFSRLLAQGPNAVIISTTFIINRKELGKLIDEIRKMSPDAFIICGGPLVYASYLLYLKQEEPDYDTHSPANDYLFLGNLPDVGVDLYIVDRHGEEMLVETISRLSKDLPLDGIPNTARWEGSQYIFSYRVDSQPLTHGVDWLQLPDSVFSPGVVNMQASLGCPFACTFCNFIKDRKSTMLKPLDGLFKELHSVVQRGVKYIRFVDDNFRLGNADLNDVCRQIIEEGLDIRWLGFMRASTLDKTDFALLKKAGCTEVQIGIESLDEGLLTAMKKEAEPDMYRRVVKGLLDIGINCSCCFIFGYPGETRETIAKTVSFIKSMVQDDQEGTLFWSIYPFILVPLSPIYAESERAAYGLTGYLESWQHATMDSTEAQKSILDAFLEIDTSGPIYSGDNLDIMLGLPAATRKRFTSARQKLAKKFLKSNPSLEVVQDAFKGVFTDMTGERGER